MFLFHGRFPIQSQVFASITHISMSAMDTRATAHRVSRIVPRKSNALATSVCAGACTRVCTSNTDFGNDAAAPDKSLDPRLQLLIERWPTLSKAVQQQIMLLVG